MQHDDKAIWPDFVKPPMPRYLAERMTYEQAVQDAIADYRTEQQVERVEG